ncbi:MAG: hypothetical protein JRI57_05580 [Deltaproteobacteria bacterium]|nr:hypothetical protein [Deltaproteobacteria bacterium]MBW1951548.1 hypothetical protein [Deltaproteobacteria bacterium]MBW1986794.1 hypothetical protein [Deltaproteobacteria bacterium]MBW2135215.1 hypothetical protein [Deltaproteobacteria bacterium]
MQQLLESNLEIVIEGGFIYLPLLFDPEIACEVQNSDGQFTPPPGSPLIARAGKLFVKTLSLASLVENYEKIHPTSYQQLRRAGLQKFGHDPEINDLPIDSQVRTIIFEVMPHFLRRKAGLKRIPLTETEIMDLLREKLEISKIDDQKVDKLLDLELLQNLVTRLEATAATRPEPLEGLMLAPQLYEWFRLALEKYIIDQERDRLRQALAERQQLVRTQSTYLPILLALARQGSLEVDGFGFFKTGFSNEYIIYKHIGEYVLKDYYGRFYLFPDCRVAVSTLAGLQPLVLERYKHPFLFGYASWQKICTGDYETTKNFTAENVIQALEEGINALYYGYNSRRRNGYHSLDRITQHVRTVDFDDYRISADHPKIVSGQVEVKNRYT